MKDNDEYLWSGEGEVDKDVAQLEELLKPLALRDRSLLIRSRTNLRITGTLLAAAALLLYFGLRHSPSSSTGPRLLHGERALAAGTLFVAEEGERNMLLLEGMGTLHLRAGSRLRVDQLHQDEVVLSLERGELSATVRADVRPGLFNVDTPATRCVDLGCAYDLHVEEDGRTRVEVTLGRVAFRDGDGEAFVPAGATCVASREHGAGTPHFPGSSADVRNVLSQFDGEVSAEVRRSLALKLCQLASGRVDALPLWHLLQMDDAVVVTAAALRLSELAGTPAGIVIGGGTKGGGASKLAGSFQLDRVQIADWREYLWPDPYR